MRSSTNTRSHGLTDINFARPRHASHQLMPEPPSPVRAWRSEPLTPFERRVHSQFGEDGVPSEIVRRVQPAVRTCVEFGASTGELSNTEWLIERGWRAVLIEAADTAYAELE